MAERLVGQVLEGRYLVESELGHGAMGTVYLARHVKLGRAVAIKVLHAELVGEPTMVARFEREAMIAARLHHANLVSVLDVGRTACGAHYLVMELANGRALSEIIAMGPVAPARVIALALQILDGLEHAHAAGLIHRDLKPDNIIVELDDAGREVPKIVDFGIAMLLGGNPEREGRRLTTVGLVLGTPAYMAPEQAAGHALDPSSDLFALGVILYELLAGVLPFDGATAVELVTQNMTQVPPAIAVRSHIAVSPELEAFVRALMAKDRHVRFTSARAARTTLVAVAAQSMPSQEVMFLPLVPPRAVAPRPRRCRVAITAEALVPMRFAAGTTPPPTPARLDATAELQLVDLLEVNDVASQR